MRPPAPARQPLFAVALVLAIVVPNAAPAGAIVEPAPAASADLGSTGFTGFAKRLERDFVPLVTAPGGWQRRDWTHFAAGLALVGTARAFDVEVRDAARMDPGEPQPSWYPALRSLGQAGGLAALGAGWMAGHLSHRPEVVLASQDGLEAAILAAGIVTPALKFTFGRARPNQEKGPASFHPFGGDLSLPSGEATEAFAIASAIAANTDSRWLQGTVWTLAGAVGWERLRLDAHWASDVVAGALVGGSVGTWVAHRHALPSAPDGKAARFDLVPLVGRAGRGLALHVAL